MKTSVVTLIAMLLGGLTPMAWADADAGFVLSAGTQDLASYFPPYLANGYVSTLAAPRGTEGNLAYMVAFMDYASEDISRPAAIPGWTEIDYRPDAAQTGATWLNRAPIDAAHFRDYRQALDLHSGTLTTDYRYVDGSRQTSIEVVTFISQANPHLSASQLTIRPDFDGQVQLSFAFNLWAPHQPRFPLGSLSGPQLEEVLAAHSMKLESAEPATPDRAAIWYPGDTHVLGASGDTKTLTLWLDGMAERGLTMAQAAAVELPTGLAPESVTLYQSPYRLSLNVTFAVRKDRTYRFTKYVAHSRAQWGGDAADDRKLATDARERGFLQLKRDNDAAWAQLWQSDILIEGDQGAQRAARSELYYLLASSTADTAWPIGACALTPGYSGHAFWDSDTWIFPALLLLHPERAKSLVMFRDRTLPAAQARALEYGLQGAMYPWESDPENGTEQTPHFAGVLGVREIHVNADVAIAQWQYYLATMDREWLRVHGWPVIRSVAEFWASRASYNKALHRYDIDHVTSVDEDYNDVPNDTFTNAAAAKALRIAAEAALVVGARPDPRWRKIAANLHLPFSESGQHHLDFDETVPHGSDSWGGSSVPMLLLPSVDLPMSERVRRNDYEYARKVLVQSQRDPNSMGLAPASITAAVAGDTAAAVDWFDRNLTGGTLKPPFNVRTETARNNAGYFVTAAGGLIQNLVFGFSGLRVAAGGLIAAYPPLLPPRWSSLTLRNLVFRGQHFDIRVARAASGRVTLARIPR